MISIAGPHLPGRTDNLAVIRLRARSHGPVAMALWRQLEKRKPVFPFSRSREKGPVASASGG